jgi:para-nitrobenzyl esterase
MARGECNLARPIPMPGKRVLIGTNRDESGFFIGLHPQSDAKAGDLGNLSVAQFSVVFNKYKESFPAMSQELLRIRSLTAEKYWVPSVRVAEALVAGDAKAFMYRLDLPNVGALADLPIHTDDLKFVWNNFGSAYAATNTRTLPTSVNTAWVSFIKGGPPKSVGLPNWPP